jgi:hypothetical protein
MASFITKWCLRVEKKLFKEYVSLKRGAGEDLKLREYHLFLFLAVDLSLSLRAVASHDSPSLTYRNQSKLISDSFISSKNSSLTEVIGFNDTCRFFKLPASFDILEEIICSLFFFIERYSSDLSFSKEKGMS